VNKHKRDQEVTATNPVQITPSVAKLSRRERNKEEKRGRIVAAARRLFDSKGFAQTTTQEIAEEADIGAGTLFLYAKSKEDLLVMVFKDEMYETSCAAFEQAVKSAPLIDQLMSVFEAMVAYHARDQDISRILLKEAMFPSAHERIDDMQELMTAIYQRMGDLVSARRKAEGLREEVDPVLAAQTMFSIYYFVLLTWLRGGMSRSELSHRIRGRLGLLIDGLRR
jgi:AcrR family transcriptional regulator